MKQGKTLQELASELQRQSEKKLDIVSDTREIFMNDDLSISVGETNIFTPTKHCHQQIGTFLDIPKKYYDRMLSEDNRLLTDNVNAWMHKKQSRRMIRTLDGNARAFLSDRYRRIDNDIIAEMSLNTLLNMPGISTDNVVSTEITERKLYLKVIFSHIRGEIKVGDTVESGIVISNSEIGLGGFQVAPFVHRLVCLNGMTVNDASINKRHLGSRLSAGIAYQDDTVKADDKALMLELRDTIMASASQVQFDKYVEKMREATEGEKITKPVEAVEILSKNFGFNETEKTSILENLIKDQDYSKWGMVNAVTAIANDHPDYDRATEIESIGGRVLDLNRSQWREIAA